MQRKIGMGLLSFAHGHQRSWAKVFSSRPDSYVAAVWDDNVERGRAEAKNLGVDFVADVDELLARPDVHAVAICAENAKHADLAVAAAQAGKHIMMQKPMATSVADARRIVAAVERAGVQYMQAYNLRFDPVHEMVKQLVDEGQIGRVNIVHRRHSHHFALDPKNLQQVLGWMANPQLSGGGSLMDEGAHATLWYVWMFGNPVSVTAQTSTTIPGLQVEDNAILLFQFPNNVIGTLQTSWTEVAGDSTIEIFGDKGTIIAMGTDISSSRTMREGTPPLKVYRAETGQWEYPDVKLNLARTVPPPNAFIDFLVQGKPSPVPVRVAAMAIEMAMGAYESARTERTVRLPLD
jgi:predicted dehydrogenase